MRFIFNLFLVCMCLLIATNTFAQEEKREGKREKKPKKEKIKLKQADELEGGIFNGKKINKFRGNVIFVQKETYLYCDSAYQYRKENILECFGRVKITQGDSVTLTGNHLTYYGDTKNAIMKGNVFLRDKTMTLTTNYLQYNMRSKEANYIGGGTVQDGTSTLTSELGNYNTANKIFRFKKNVNLDNPSKNFSLKSDTLNYNSATKIATFAGPTHIESKDGIIDTDKGEYNTSTNVMNLEGGRQQNSVVSGTYKLSGDKLYYDEKGKYGVAKNNVKVYSEQDKVLIEGENAYYWGNTGITKVFGNAIMKAAVGEDTLYLRADTLISIDPIDVAKKRLLAFNHARIFKSDLQGRCDSLSYNVADSIIYFYHDPVLWSGKNQITADSINIQMAQNKIHRMNMRLNSFIVSQDTLQNFNQIKGRDMTGFFKDDEIYRINVNGNGESIYFALNKDSIVSGMNKVVCSDMVIKFDSSKVKSISFIKKPDGKFMPPHEVKEPDKKLKGFAWREEEKPQFADIVMFKK